MHDCFFPSHRNWRAAFQRLERAYSPATMRSYFTDVEAFETWCGAAGHTVFPASIETVCTFLEAQGRDKAASTVRCRLYAIRKAHGLLGLKDPTQDEEINLAPRQTGPPQTGEGAHPRLSRPLPRRLAGDA